MFFSNFREKWFAERVVVSFYNGLLIKEGRWPAKLIARWRMVGWDLKIGGFLVGFYVLVKPFLLERYNLK